MNPLLWRLRFYLLAVIVCCLLPVLFLYVAYRAWVQKRPMTGFWRKFSGANPTAVEKNQIMVHGVSMGEVNLMRPVIPLIEQQLGATCFVSSSTDTGIRSLEKHFSDRHRCVYPLDMPWAITRFLHQQQPSLVILLELEIWPLFLAACFSRRIPVVILNARVGDRSFAGFKRWSWFWRPVFKSLRGAIAQNEQWAERLRQLGVQQVRVAASLKADVVQLADMQRIQQERLRLQLDQRPVFLGASTGQHEEALLLDCVKTWSPAWQIILCPRHPERGQQIKQLAVERGLSAVCTSNNPTSPVTETCQIIIVDEIGCLGALYGLADIAVVGGSIGSGRHGQNMLEAAAAGTCTIVGWDTSNQPDAMSLLRSHNAVVECRDKNDLQQHLQALSADAPRRQELGQLARAAWQENTGAAERSVQLLAEMLNGN